MFMRGVIAAKSNAASLTGAQVQPVGMQPDAFLTDVFFGGFDVGDSAQMFAKICHESKDKFFLRSGGVDLLPVHLLFEDFPDGCRLRHGLGLPEIGLGLRRLSHLLIKLSEGGI